MICSRRALRLKDALALRSIGIWLRAGQDDKGEWLQVTYHDEAGAEVGERYRLHTPAQRRFFALRFLPLHRRGHFWQVREKVFDYQGRLRSAHELRG